MPTPQMRRRMSQWGGVRYSDAFDTLSANWTTQLGTLTAAGTLTASAIESDGNELISNGEFTTNTDGWGSVNTNATRVDSASDPGSASGGADAYAVKTVATADGSTTLYQNGIGIIPGVTYAGACRAYAPSANTTGSRLHLAGGWNDVVAGDGGVRNSWIALAPNTTVASDIAGNVWLRMNGATAGDVAYFDSVSAQQQLAIATLSTWRYSDGTYAFDVAMPASGVVPIGHVFRYTDASNYWLAQPRPGTAGSDLFLFEVNAGTVTERISADVDWGTSVTDQVRVGLNGSTITLYHKKSGESTWTNAGSYGSATLNQTATAHGPVLYSTSAGVAAITRVEYQP